jgi:hypothetical protein
MIQFLAPQSALSASSCVEVLPQRMLSASTELLPQRMLLLDMVAALPQRILSLTSPDVLPQRIELPHSMEEPHRIELLPITEEPFCRRTMFPFEFSVTVGDKALPTDEGARAVLANAA